MYMLHCIYSGILPQRHQDTKTIELFFIISSLMRDTLKLMKKLRYSIYIYLFFGSLCLGGWIVTFFYTEIKKHLRRKEMEIKTVSKCGMN